MYEVGPAVCTEVKREIREIRFKVKMRKWWVVIYIEDRTNGDITSGHLHMTCALHTDCARTITLTVWPNFHLTLSIVNCCNNQSCFYEFSDKSKLSICFGLKGWFHVVIFMWWFSCSDFHVVIFIWCGHVNSQTVNGWPVDAQKNWSMEVILK